MARVEATPHELKTAARWHRLQANVLTRSSVAGPSRSAVLLRFYSVESGLKAGFLIDKRHKTTLEIPDGSFGADGHDLESGIKAVNAPASIGRPPRLRRKGTRKPITIAQSHQALRYGVELERPDFDKLNTWLEGVLAWLCEKGLA